MCPSSVRDPSSAQIHFRFRSGFIRFPEAQPDADVLDGLDPAAAASCGEPSFLAPTPIGDENLAVHMDSEESPIPPGWRELPVRAALLAAASRPGAESNYGAHLFFRAYHLSQWRSESVFCGRCGSRNGDAPDELARLCPSCGRREYPRISPAVIVLVTRSDGRALLAHNAKFREGMYSLVAGFVEAGERLEDAVAREVMEEVGLSVAGVRYRESQAWPFPNSIMLAFTAEWTGGEPRPDGIEISDAAWFSPDALPEIPGPGSVARSLIDSWRFGNWR